MNTSKHKLSNGREEGSTPFARTIYNALQDNNLQRISVVEKEEPVKDEQLNYANPRLAAIRQQFPNEIWREIPCLTGYAVSHNGRVIFLKDGFELPQNPDRDGYLRVRTHIRGVDQKHGVHRLVASAFIDNPEQKSLVNHKNGVRSDNRVANLEWVTSRENARHSFKRRSEAKSALYENERMERRERIATSILSGLVANPSGTCCNLVQKSVQLADALVAELEGSK